MTITTTDQIQEYTLYAPQDYHLVIKNLELQLEQHGIKILSCRLKFQLDYETYNYLEQAGLFNLKKEVKGRLSQGRFYPDLEVHLEVELKPKLLPVLSKIGTSKQVIAEYIANFKSAANESLEESIVYTENWYCLSVGQEQEGEDVGYRTLWNHANSTTINNAATSTGEALQGVVTFLQEAIKSYQDSPEITSARQKLEQEFDRLVEELSIVNNSEQRAIPSRPISEVMLDFFIEDNWDYYWWEEGETLQLQCQVTNGRLTCYAKAINEREQFIFYTLCPLTAPEANRNAIAEFITRVNYGMAIGNFEFDFDDGEIRYKTSLDLEGDRLSHNLIKQVVYLNILTMDRYLPAIVAVIEGELSPSEAIKQIE